MTNVIDKLHFTCVNRACPYKARTYLTTKLHGIARLHCSVSNSDVYHMIFYSLIFKE